MPPQHTRTCPVCGSEFTRKGKQQWAKTCSRRCGARLWRGDRETRFWSHVDRGGGPDACWPWQGGTHPKTGYGMCNHTSYGEKYAHRVAWSLANGQSVPPEKKVLHSCDNRPCCNPTHMFLGTQADNMADMVAKGRSADKGGTKNGRAKLTPEAVHAIRSNYAQGGISQQALANRYGVSQRHVSKVVRGLAWQDT